MWLDNERELAAQMLQALYDAECQLVLALPRVAARVADAELRDLLEDHLAQTVEHAVRLERIAADLGVPCRGRPSFAMQGLLRDGDAAIGYGGPDELVDAAVRLACRSIEGFEIAQYRALGRLCSNLGAREASALLMSTISDEEEMLERLEDAAATDADGADDDERERGALPEASAAPPFV